MSEGDLAKIEPIDKRVVKYLAKSHGWPVTRETAILGVAPGVALQSLKDDIGESFAFTSVSIFSRGISLADIERLPSEYQDAFYADPDWDFEAPMDEVRAYEMAYGPETDTLVFKRIEPRSDLRLHCSLTINQE
jgi:hypothetical protein